MPIFKSGPRKRFGAIRIVYPPSNPKFGREIQRADESTSTGNPSTKSTERRIIGTLQPGNYSFSDFIQTCKFYRNRRVRLGYDPSTWSAWQGVSPAGTDEDVTITPEREGIARASRSLSRTYPVTKTVRLPAQEGVARFEDDNYRHDGGYVHSNSTSNLQWDSSVVLPRGVRIIDLRARMYRDSTTDSAQATLFRVSDTGGVTSVTPSALSHSSTGWATVSSTADETVSTSHYYLNVVLNPSTNNDGARYLWFEIDYEMDRYDQTL